MSNCPAESSTPCLTATTRRRFLAHLAASSAAMMLPGAGLSAAAPAAGRTLVGSNIYGWGQYAQRDGKKLEVEEVISGLRDAGYDYLENFMDVGQPEANARFADQLKAKGLQPVSLYVGARLHEAGKADESIGAILAAAKVCHRAGFQVISCNPDPIGREKTDEELKIQAAALAKLGQGLQELGLKFGVHHHLPEMVSKAREFHYTFRNTPAQAVGWCYDVHWVWRGGLSPANALREYGDRVVTWHLRQSRNQIWWENLDTGDIDYAEVARYAREHALPRRFTVELAIEPGTKITRTAIENHRRSREFVRRVLKG